MKENINEEIKNSKNEIVAVIGDAASKDDKVEEYKDKYGKIYNVQVTVEPDDDTTLEYSFIFKKPIQASFDRYMRSMSNSPMKAARTFINDNVISEHKESLDKAIQEYPALVITVSDKLLSALGLGKESNIKKL